MLVRVEHHLTPQQAPVIIPQPSITPAHPVVQPLVVTLTSQKRAVVHLRLHARYNRHLLAPPAHLAGDKGAFVVAAVFLIKAAFAVHHVFCPLPFVPEGV
jgi:hypothetical protein